jgi:hypothetical protein
VAHILTIADTAVQQDADGRFSLNDLHRAAGAEERHQPSKWLRGQQAQELIVELSTGQIRPVETAQGNGGGTFVARELVYAYAMWISARFHLQVIRAYDALVLGQAPTGATDPARPVLTLPHLLAAQRQVQRLLAAVLDCKTAPARGMLYQHLVDAQHLMGHATPPLQELLQPADPRQPSLPGMGGAAA